MFVFIGYSIVCWLMLEAIFATALWVLLGLLLLPYGAYLSWQDRRRLLSLQLGWLGMAQRWACTNGDAVGIAPGVNRLRVYL